MSAPECITKTFKLTTRLAAAIKRWEGAESRYIAAPWNSPEYHEAWDNIIETARDGMILLAQQARKARDQRRKAKP